MTKINEIRKFLKAAFPTTQFKIRHECPSVTMDDAYQISWAGSSGPSNKKVADTLFAANYPAVAEETAWSKYPRHYVDVIFPIASETEICDQFGLELVDGRWTRRPQFFRRGVENRDLTSQEAARDAEIMKARAEHVTADRLF